MHVFIFPSLSHKNGEALEDDAFTYRGSVIDKQGGTAPDTRKRIKKACAAFMKLQIFQPFRLSSLQFTLQPCYLLVRKKNLILDLLCTCMSQNLWARTLN